MNSFGFNYNKKDILCCDGIPLSKIATTYQTPVFVYSSLKILNNYHSLNNALKESRANIHFALKANSTLGIISLLSKEGSGADIVSGGELKKALSANIPPSKIIFSGVGKTDDEIRLAISNKIKQINVESVPEIERIISISESLREKVAVSLRVNPDIIVQTHEKIATGSSETKFGMPMKQAKSLYKSISKEKSIIPMGLAIHIGSQIFDNSKFKVAYESILELSDELRSEGFSVPHLDLGGGLGVNYDNGSIDFQNFGNTINEVFKGKGYSLSIEPGRSLVANGGILLTKVIFIKKTNTKQFVIVDAAMNDFIRPTLYEANHNIREVIKNKTELEYFDVVGPICETGDFFGKNVKLGQLKENDLIIIESAGAYGSVMSSNYNSRPPAGEVLTYNNEIFLLREKESIEDQIAREFIPF